MVAVAKSYRQRTPARPHRASLAQSEQNPNKNNHVILLEEKTSREEMRYRGSSRKAGVTAGEYLRDGVSRANETNWGNGKDAVIRLETFSTRAEYDALRSQYEGSAMILSVGHGHIVDDANGVLLNDGIGLPSEGLDAFVPRSVIESGAGCSGVFCTRGDLKSLTSVIPTIQQSLYPIE